MPLSIIVGCLPTLRPLFKGPQPDRTRPYEGQDDSYTLTDYRTDNKTQKTIPIDLDINKVSAGDSRSLERTAWDVEARG